MSGNRCLADTNAFIYLLEKNPVIEPLLEDEWLFSFITEIELLGKPGLKGKEEKIVRDLLNTAIKVPHLNQITEHAIDIRREYHLKIPDSIIAGTARYLGIPLITADKDFIKVEDLDILLLELE